MSESLSEWQKLQQSADRARLVGDQEQAVVLLQAGHGPTGYTVDGLFGNGTGLR